MDNRNINGILEAINNINFEGDLVSYSKYGNGHINDTFLVITKKDDKEYKYILQRMNKYVFNNPIKLMDNIVKVTSFLRNKIIQNNGNPDRETLTVVKTKDNKFYFVDKYEEYWRAYIFINDATSFDKAENVTDFEESGYAFGNFQYLLSEFDATSISETIPNFHNTEVRFKKFKDVLNKDAFNRANEVKEEIEFVLNHEDLSKRFNKLINNGDIKLRVTHNDTKLNNVMIDNFTHKGICVIDLDTVMPGLMVNDFGDSIRFGASTALEDEHDLNKVNLDLNLFEAYTRGFLSGVKDKITDSEIENLPYGAICMTYECGMRFLTDYLEGDVYFKTHYDKQNLYRCRTQFKLVKEMLAKVDEMNKIVAKYVKK